MKTEREEMIEQLEREINKIEKTNYILPDMVKTIMKALKLLLKQQEVVTETTYIIGDKEIKVK